MKQYNDTPEKTIHINHLIEYLKYYRDNEILQSMYTPVSYIMMYLSDKLGFQLLNAISIVVKILSDKNESEINLKRRGLDSAIYTTGAMPNKKNLIRFLPAFCAKFPDGQLHPNESKSIEDYYLKLSRLIKEEYGNNSEWQEWAKTYGYYKSISGVLNKNL